MEGRGGAGASSPVALPYSPDRAACSGTGRCACRNGQVIGSTPTCGAETFGSPSFQARPSKLRSEAVLESSLLGTRIRRACRPAPASGCEFEFRLPSPCLSLARCQPQALEPKKRPWHQEEIARPSLNRAGAREKSSEKLSRTLASPSSSTVPVSRNKSMTSNARRRSRSE